MLYSWSNPSLIHVIGTLRSKFKSDCWEWRNTRTLTRWSTCCWSCSAATTSSFTSSSSSIYGYAFAFVHSSDSESTSNRCSCRCRSRWRRIYGSSAFPYFASCSFGRKRSSSDNARYGCSSQETCHFVFSRAVWTDAHQSQSSVEYAGKHSSWLFQPKQQQVAADDSSWTFRQFRVWQNLYRQVAQAACSKE